MEYRSNGGLTPGGFHFDVDEIVRKIFESDYKDKIEAISLKESVKKKSKKSKNEK